jgi:hypothetical protein
MPPPPLFAQGLFDRNLGKEVEIKKKTRPILEQMAKVMRKITSPRTTPFP